jgi:excisionase family DNA binding protein
MAGTFYTLQEAAQKLGKTESQVRELIKEGKIREYRDGTKVLYKQDEINKLAEESDTIDLVADSEIGLELEKTAEIKLEPDISPDSSKKPDSEGGFGLSQMGDLTMADTNVGTVGINVLGDTDDHYKVTSDTKAETKAAELEEVESLDADANLESVGSGSGLLDLSLQADDTSLGAVLHDILPTGPDIPAQAEAAAPVDFAKEAEGLLHEPEGAGEAAGPVMAAPVAAISNGAAAPMGTQLVAIAPPDPASNIYGIMMFFPLFALILAGIATTAGLRGILPSIVKFLSYQGLADINWGFIIAIVLLLTVIVFSVFAMLAAGKTQGKTDVYQKKP